MHSLPPQISLVEPIEGLIGPSAALRRLREKITRVAAAPRTTVLVTGESGVGKEVVAKGIHARSERRDGPFIALNCAALTDGLLEAELFGHEPGAYTGASNKGRDGLFAAANGGTLLLDEIGELAPELQAKLLRVLQERCYRRVGGNKDQTTDVRIIACTNRDLSQLVEEGLFREDLYYRLNVLVLRVSPLRERRDDISPIALHLCDEIEREHGMTTGGLSEASLATLEAHSWPGNVRELKNAIERAAVECAGATIEPEHLGITPTSSAAAIHSEDDSVEPKEDGRAPHSTRAQGDRRQPQPLCAPPRCQSCHALQQAAHLSDRLSAARALPSEHPAIGAELPHVSNIPTPLYLEPLGRKSTRGNGVTHRLEKFAGFRLSTIKPFQAVGRSRHVERNSAFTMSPQETKTQSGSQRAERRASHSGHNTEVSK